MPSFMALQEAVAPAIRLRGIRRVFGRGEAAVNALAGIDLSIEHGQFVVLLGPSGSGKTTLLNIVGGIDTPTIGDAEVDGVDLTGLDRSHRSTFRRFHVAFVFQFFNLVPTLNALENVELIASVAPDPALPPEAALAAVGLGDKMGRFPAQLSGGEQQRVAIARALAKRSSVVLCDEPTGALDLETGRQVLELLLRVNRDHGRTVLVVTHNATIASMADRVIRMRDGKVIDDQANNQPLVPSALQW